MALISSNGPQRGRGGERAIALMEAGKGLVALLVGSGLLLLWDADLQALGDNLARHLHLNPGRLHGNVLWRALTASGNDHVPLLAAGVLCYAGLRFTEAAGLWRGRRWAEWIGVLSGAVYVPLEVRELLIKPGLLTLTLLAANAAIVGYLAIRLRSRRSRS